MLKQLFIIFSVCLLALVACVKSQTQTDVSGSNSGATGSSEIAGSNISNHNDETKSVSNTAKSKT
ncbi:MAG: hypothetical protein ACR2GD_14060, partial [Pyrinomonadaceae bacterium]